jgi:hypothetical protein
MHELNYIAQCINPHYYVIDHSLENQLSIHVTFEFHNISIYCLTISSILYTSIISHKLYWQHIILFCVTLSSF